MALIDYFRRIKLSLILSGLFCFCLISGCTGSSSSVEDYRKVSRKTYELLSESDKQSLIEDLHSAAKRGDNEALRKVLNRGVSPDATPPGWWTPMMEAASKGNITIIQSLLEFGANVNHSNDIGMTALISAAVNKRPEIIKFLLSSEADVNQKDKDGHTALYRAQTMHCDECVELLTKAGGTSSLSSDFYEKSKNKKR